jgi:DNA-binding MarR family transcriptional regulator
MLDDADQSLGRLFVNVCRLHHTKADQCMEQFGLYRGQAILLMILSEKDGMTHSDIADRLKISPAAATRVIKRLEALNYLQRQPDLNDERISRVYLQEKGRILIDEIHRSFRNLERVMFNDFSTEDEDIFRDLLMRIQSNLQNGKLSSEK